MPPVQFAGTFQTPLPPFQIASAPFAGRAEFSAIMLAEAIAQAIHLERARSRFSMELDAITLNCLARLA
jgi:hypothetical protein